MDNVNFVNSFNIIGVEVAQIPCLTGHGEPLQDFALKVGLLYINEDSGEMYKCIKGESDLIWELVNSHNNITPDWNQNDSTASDYIKNRTHYEEEAYTDSVEIEVGNLDSNYLTDPSIIAKIYEQRKVITINFDGEIYRYLNDVIDASVSEEWHFSITNGTYIGYVRVINNSGVKALYIGRTETSSPSTCIVTYFNSKGTSVHKIDHKFLPDDILTNDYKNIIEEKLIGRKGTGDKSEVFNDTGNIASGDLSHSEGRTTNAVGRGSHAEGDSTVAGSMTSSLSSEISDLDTYQQQSPGAGAHSEGIGSLAKKAASHAEGYKTQAEENASHAEGDRTEAREKASHAEGCLTIAHGKQSHAEGDGTYASGDGSHAEGCMTYATGKYSHAEGTKADPSDTLTEVRTTASGYGSHAEGVGTLSMHNGSHSEGVRTVANNEGSHAEGGGTIATGKYSHVQGKYNVEDTENKYAHIVGGGTSDTERKNVHTIDWNGVPWFEGVPKVGGTSQDDENAVSLITSKDQKSLILNADDAELYKTDYTYGEAALAAIKAGKQILVKVPNADGGVYTAIYSPVMMYQLPKFENDHLYLFFLRDEKQDLSSIVPGLMIPTYGELQMILSAEYNSDPLEE